MPADVPLDDVTLVQAHLPPPWVAELAVGAIASGRADGWLLLDRTWPGSRPVVAGLAEPGQPKRTRVAAKAALSRLPVPPGRRLALTMLGTMGLTAGGVPVRAREWGRERVRLLLAYLVLHPSATRAQIAEDLWPTIDVDDRDANLRVTLSYLLRVFEPNRAPRDPSFFVRSDGNSLSLHRSDWLGVDLWDFDAHASAAGNAEQMGRVPQDELTLALAAVELWSEPPELSSEEWALREVDARRHRFATLAVRAGELMLARGDVEAARMLAGRALEVDPWREATHRLLVSAHQMAGDQLAARRAVQRYQEVLDELGVKPADASLMVERLLRGVSGSVR